MFNKSHACLPSSCPCSCTPRRTSRAVGPTGSSSSRTSACSQPAPSRWSRPAWRFERSSPANPANRSQIGLAKVPICRRGCRPTKTRPSNRTRYYMISLQLRIILFDNGLSESEVPGRYDARGLVDAGVPRRAAKASQTCCGLVPATVGKMQRATERRQKFVSLAPWRHFCRHPIACPPDDDGGDATSRRLTREHLHSRAGSPGPSRSTCLLPCEDYCGMLSTISQPRQDSS